jgi:hypothetical protein
MKMNLVVLPFVLLTAAGCATRQPSPQFTDADYGALPSDYKQIAVEYIKNRLRDPDSAHIRVSDERPEKWPEPVHKVPAYAVKLYVNAKNGFGGYTGEHLMIVWISHGQAVNSIDVSQPF